MSPGSSSAGPLTTDRPPAENFGEKLNGKGTPRKRRNNARYAEMTQVLGHGYLVTGTHGRSRMVIVAARCPFADCGRPHVHNSDPHFTSGKRTAGCHGGMYVVRLRNLEGEVAA